MTTPTPPPAKQVLAQKIYLRDASVEVPKAPSIFTRQGQPQMDVQVNTDVKGIGEDHWEVVLSVTVTAKLVDEVAFLVEAQQAGIFTVKGFTDNAERQQVLAVYCPNIIFPFARETVADLVQRAGFPQLLLQPISFEAVYAEHLKRAKTTEQASVSGKPH